MKQCLLEWLYEFISYRTGTQRKGATCLVSMKQRGRAMRRAFLCNAAISVFAQSPPILDRLGDMRMAYRRVPGQICDRARNLEHPVIRAG
jgi:hypothetical protein